MSAGSPSSAPTRCVPIRTFVGQLAADQELVEQALRRLILERTEEWVVLAAERLGGTRIRLHITPWHTNRECTEDVLAGKLSMVHESADPSRTIFNIHVPPYDCGLDFAARLDDSLQIQLKGGSRT